MLDISVAGHLSSGDSPLEAAIREVEEEIGILLKKEQLHFKTKIKQQHVTKNGTFIDNEIAYVYIVYDKIDIAKLTLQETEVDSVEWMRLQDYVAVQTNGDCIKQGFVPLDNPTIYISKVFQDI